MNIGDKIKIKYSKGITVGTIDRLWDGKIHINSSGMGGMTIPNSQVRKLDPPYRKATYQYQSFN